VRRQSALVTIVALILLIGSPLAILTIVFNSYRHPGRTSAGYLCSLQYRRARTTEDTANIDRLIYPNGRAGPELACGILRRRGELRPWTSRRGYL